MIYDIVNAIVYVILAQMFCSTFLKREQHSSMIYGVITIIWIISVFSIGTICESTLLLRIVLIVLLSIIISLILYKKNNIAMTVVIPILYNTLGFACEFFIVCIHRFLDPGLVIEQVMDSKISIYMGIVSQLLQCILILVLRKAFWKTKTTEISTKLWIIYMIFPVYSLSVIILIAYSFNETINTFASVFTVLLPEVEIKKVTPSDYRLFQTADMFCSMELIRLKMDAAALSPSELEFFGNVRDMKKNYLNPLEKFRWD